MVTTPVNSLTPCSARAGYDSSTSVGMAKRGGRPTIQGNALAQARLAAPITRASAERHLRSVIQRADEYNTDDKH
jgi:hypothetical protein